jgi:MFS family permease
MATATDLLRRATGRLDGLVGGPARRRVIVVFACVLALDSADKATIGASATQLQSGLGIGRTDIGLLLSVSSLVGAATTVPAGMLVDRMNRTRLLVIAVALWGGAMGLSGLATGFGFLLGSRIALGAVTAAASPAIASLIGDYFPERERGRIYGYVLSGELIGAGFGFVVAGQFANLSWRAPFLVLVVPTAFVWWLVWRLPEPKRGGASRLAAGTHEIGAGGVGGTGGEHGQAGSAEPPDQAELARDAVRESDVEPNEHLVLREDPKDMPLRTAIRYVLRVRSNVVLIIASALGYFFFSGVRGFAVEFAKQHYRISQSTATSVTLFLGIGALGGVLLGGRFADRWLGRGRLAARVEVAGGASLCAAVLFVPALITGTLWLAIVLLTLASFFLGATSPPLDAARLDIIPPRLWGRAEAVRTVLRSGGDAAAPVLFGFISASAFGGSSGLEYTFLLMLAAVLVGAVIVLVFGRRYYPADVATAAHSVDSIRTS